MHINKKNLESSILYLIYFCILYNINFSQNYPTAQYVHNIVKEQVILLSLKLYDGLLCFFNITKPYKKTVQHLWMSGGINKRIHTPGRDVTKIPQKENVQLLIPPIFPIMPEGYK